MVNKPLIVYLVLQVLFIASGGLVLAIAVIFNGKDVNGPADIATNLLLNNCSLNAGIGNAAIIFITSLLSIPALMNSKDRKWLRAQSWLILLCGLVSLVVGLVIWFFTLQTRRNLLNLYWMQPPEIQSALQRDLNCCGYMDANTPPFIQDSTCVNSFIAARLGPCLPPFSSYANILLDTIFTGLFGLVAIDGLLFLATMVMIKQREQAERYQAIDRKYGVGGI